MLHQRIRFALKGFTLLELLVAIAILGTISALLLPNLINARQRGRDSQRKQDLRNISSALELYKQDQNPPAYPTPSSNKIAATGGQFANGSTIYMSKLPGDPSDSTGATGYYYTVTGLTYSISACLENSADPQAVACPGGMTCASSKCYTVNVQ